jgi:hypothetical protein
MSQTEPSQTHGTDSIRRSDRGPLNVGVTVVHSRFADSTPPDSSDDDSSSDDGEGQYTHSPMRATADLPALQSCLNCSRAWM